MAVGCLTTVGTAQEPSRGTVIAGRVTDAATREPVAGAAVLIEGTTLRALTNEDGQYRVTNFPAGPQVLTTRRVGYAPARVPVTVPSSGSLTQDIALARTNLRLRDIIVTADPTGRAQGELGTASVIDRDARGGGVGLAKVGAVDPGVAGAQPADALGGDGENEH